MLVPKRQYQSLDYGNIRTLIKLAVQCFPQLKPYYTFVYPNEDTDFWKMRIREVFESLLRIIGAEENTRLAIAQYCEETADYLIVWRQNGTDFALQRKDGGPLQTKYTLTISVPESQGPVLSTAELDKGGFLLLSKKVLDYVSD